MDFCNRHMAAKFKSGELSMPKDAASNEDPAEPLHAYTGRKVLFLVSFVHIKFVACMLTLEKGSCFVLSVCVSSLKLPFYLKAVFSFGHNHLIFVLSFTPHFSLCLSLSFNNKGDAVLFHPWTMHAPSRNLSDRSQVCVCVFSEP